MLRSWQGDKFRFVQGAGLEGRQAQRDVRRAMPGAPQKKRCRAALLVGYNGRRGLPYLISSLPFCLANR